MSTLDDNSLSQLAQSLSEMDFSPQEVQLLLQNPERVMDLMKRTAAKSIGSTSIGDNETELNEEDSRCKQEAQLPLRKPAPTQRKDLELNNKKTREVSTHKSTVFKTFFGQKTHFSTTPVTQLTRISLCDMFASQIHKGRYFICRTILKPARRVALELSVEDPHGQVTSLSVSNFPGLFLAEPKTLEAYFPVGTVMAIREPWLRLSSLLSSSNGFISVDSPSDIIFLEPSDPILADVKWSTSPYVYRHPVTTPEQWKSVGNKLFADGLFVPAARAWTRGLEQDASMHPLRLNRSQAYIRLEWFSAALSDALHVLSSPDCEATISRKASYRAACAEYGTGCYLKALTRLETIDKDADVRSLMSRCRSRIKESTTGEYDWLEMFRAIQQAEIHPDVADFVHPDVSVATLPTRGGGRCIQAARDIKAGELLVVAKPFASVFRSDLPKNQFVHGLNFLTRQNCPTTLVALISRVIEKLHGCPEDHDLMYHLYSGPAFPLNPTTYPPPRAQILPSVTPLIWDTDIDVEKIAGIISYNTFSPMDSVSIGQPPIADSDMPNAVYTVPSMFNHSCHANTLYRYFGDVMVIRARENISQGTEITLSYYAMGDTYIAREPGISTILREPCDCVMCTSDRNDGKALCEERETLMEGIRGNVEHSSAISNRKAAVAQAERVALTYRSPQHIPRPPLFFAYFGAMQAIKRDAERSRRLDLTKLSIQQGFKALNAAGFTGLDTSLALGKRQRRRVLPFSKNSLAHCAVDITACIALMAHLSALFVALSETILAERWFRGAWWVHDAAFGGAKALFDARLGKLLDNLPIPPMQYGWD